MILFAIRKKGTNDYLPAHRTRNGGYSYDEPVLDGGRWGPRFHFTKRGAQNCLISWLQGYWIKETSGGRPALFGEGYDDLEVAITPTPAPTPRLREDMEIVPFFLQELVASGPTYLRKT